MKLFEPLRLPPFRRFYAAQVVANFGDGLDFLAIVAIVVYQWHRGAGALGALALCSAVPLVLGAPLYGLLADRYPSRWVMAAANLTRAAATAGLVAAGDLATICALSVVVALAGGGYGAAQQRFIQAAVPDALRLRANSLKSTTERLLIGLIGPGLAGVTIALVGPRATLVVTAVSFAVAAAVVVTVGADPVREAVPTRAPLRVRMVEGFTHVRSDPALRLVVVGMAVAYLFAMMFDVMLPVWYRDMGGDATYMAIGMMCLGAGGVAGAVWLARADQGRNLVTVMATCAVVIGLVVGLMGVAGLAGVAGLLAVWLAAVAVVGAAASAALISYGTLIQRLTPAGLMGRVAAVSNAGMTAPTVVAPAVAPFVVAAVGIDGTFAWCGLFLVLTGVFIGRRGRAYGTRDTERTAEPQPPEQQPPEQQTKEYDRADG